VAPLVGLSGLKTAAASTAPVAAEHGMVAHGRRLATRGRRDVLRRGGYAVVAGSTKRSDHCLRKAAQSVSRPGASIV
jgi:hypothetical protein